MGRWVSRRLLGLRLEVESALNRDIAKARFETLLAKVHGLSTTKEEAIHHHDGGS